MSIIPTILPITLLIAAVFFLSINAKRKFVTLKVTHWLLIIYVGVLLLSMIAANIMKNQTPISVERFSKEEILRNYGEFTEALNNGEIEQLKANHLLKLSSFEYDQPMLDVLSTGIGAVTIYVERKDIDDGTIEAYAFQSGLYINGLDFSEKMVPPNFSLYSNKFEVIIPHENIDVSIIKNEFTVTQFFGGGVMFEGLDQGDYVVYLQVPKSLKVSSDTGMGLNFIE